MKVSGRLFSRRFQDRKTLMFNACTERPGARDVDFVPLPWLLLLFFGSGCAALIYEVVWLQLLQLIVGLTSAALGFLLCGFMGGLGLGSVLLPRWVGSQRHPLRVYAALEAAIGFLGLILLWAAPWVANIYSALGAGHSTRLILRGLVSAGCLLPPTMMMGATLPAMARWVKASPHGVSRLGLFYGGNTLGAVFGCLLAGFYLLRVYDVAVATYVAATINAVVAVMAFQWARQCPRSKAVKPVLSAPNPVASSGNGATEAAWPVLLTIGLSGMTALGAEVVWTRLLSLLLGGTVYTFSLILAVFLTGIGVGSAAASALGRFWPRPRVALALCQAILVGVIGWAAWNIAGSLPHWPTNPALSLSPWYNFQLDVARVLWVVLPAATLWGASFPLALASVSSAAADPAKVVGRVYAANTLGGIIGALGFSLVATPALGTQNAERALIGLAAASAGLMFTSLAQSERKSVASDADPAGWGSLAAGVIAVSLLLSVWMPATPWGLGAYGRYVATYGRHLKAGITARVDIPQGGDPADIYCSYFGEGVNGTIAVTETAAGIRNFHSAGKVQASNDPHDMRLQRMLGHLSVLANPNPQSVLVVACGAGVTAGAISAHPEVERIVICDIEPLVPRVVAPMFAKENFDVLRDPRTTVVDDDGRHFVRTTADRFDIITSDPIDPWVKGCAALNTIEYYEMCKARLKPGGVMSLWIPLYESDATTIKSLLATFFKVFPAGTLWSNDNEGQGYDAVLLGQADGTHFNIDQLEARLSRADYVRVKQSLAETGFASAGDILATYAGQAVDLRSWTGDAPLNTDTNLRLQYLAGWAFNSYVSGEILDELIQHRRFPGNLITGSYAKVESLKRRIANTPPSGARGPSQTTPRPP